MRGSSALPKAKAKAKARPKKTIAKYAHLPPDLRGAARFLDERNLIANINKVMNRDGRVETPLPRGDDPVHVGRVLGDIARRIDRSAPAMTRISEVSSRSPSRASRSVPAMTRVSEVSSRSPSRVGRSVAAMTPIPERRSRSPSAVSVASSLLPPFQNPDPTRLPPVRSGEPLVPRFPRYVGGRSLSEISESESRARRRAVSTAPAQKKPVQYGGSSSSTADPLGLFS